MCESSTCGDGAQRLARNTPACSLLHPGTRCLGATAVATVVEILRVFILGARKPKIVSALPYTTSTIRVCISCYEEKVQKRHHAPCKTRPSCGRSRADRGAMSLVKSPTPSVSKPKRYDPMGYYNLFRKTFPRLQTQYTTAIEFRACTRLEA